MKKLLMTAFVAAAFLAVGCSDDDVNDPINPIGDSKDYTLHSVSDPDISGNVTFLRNEDNSTTVTIDLNGTTSGHTYPAHIHNNSAEETGDIAISLNPVSGDTGESVTTFSASDDGTAISYNDLLNFDGHINVHLSETEMATLVAQADIGGNELTGESKDYDLHEVDVVGTTGTVLFEERKNGEVLATITVDPTDNDDMHPAFIRESTIAEGTAGNILFTFDPVDGATGKSVTNMDLDDEALFSSLADLTNFDGHISVHQSEMEMDVIIAQADIGENELTEESATYQLDAIANTEFSGEATFEQRMNGETLITISLDGALDGETYPAHIHTGTAAAAPGTTTITLNAVDGDTGMSRTNVSVLDDDSSITYDDLMEYDGYLDVHLEGSDILAGDIGSNAL